MNMPETCGNCGTPLQGPFCHRCGQKDVGTRLVLRDILHEAFHELAHVDGKLVRTLKLLVVSPGMLTVEFLNRRRARYISPFKLYLTCSLMFFALAAIKPDVMRSMIKVRSNTTEQTRDVNTEHRDQELADTLGEQFLHTMPRVMFVLMPLFGWLTWMFYKKAQPFFAAHLYYAIHLHAFAFLALAAFALCAFTGRYGKAAGGFIPLAVVPYHYLALRRVFGGSAIETAWKGSVVALLYFLALATIGIAQGLLFLKSRGML
jgi:hypothetical protein